MIGNLDSGPVKIFSRSGMTSCLVLILVVWVGNFLEFEKFTLYVDDWGYFGWFARIPWNFEGFIDGVIPFGGGRPVQYGLVYLVGALMSNTGSIGAGYIF